MNKLSALMICFIIVMAITIEPIFAQDKTGKGSLMKAGVTGIGGIFFKSEDPKKLSEWYVKHLGFKLEPSGQVMFRWHDEQPIDKNALTIWSPFPKDTKYFEPSTASFMINFRVMNLDLFVEQLRKDGVKVDDKIEEYVYGRFAWLMDPEGNRVELWEPPKE